jgi:IclR family transcriptional regulator, KDG regulon repressor
VGPVTRGESVTRRDSGAPLVRYRVQVLERALGLLDVLASVDKELGPAELASMIGLHRSTIHRLLKVLEEHRFVRRNSVGKYDLGLKLFELGTHSVSRFNLPRRAGPFLKQVVSETGETAHICVFSNMRMLSIAAAEASWVPRAIGHRGDLHASAAGKALLAFLSQHAQEDLISRLALPKHTRNTIDTVGRLKAELARVRRLGFSLNDEEVEEGVRCIAAPIFDHKGRAIATLSVAGPVFRMTRRRMPKLVRIVKGVAEALSTELGHQKRTGGDSVSHGGTSLTAEPSVTNVAPSLKSRCVR